ncbi:MAG: carbohydrate ABC transporter permease [Rhodospirillaceae bacterium]|nr:carbohydrate ABC transporter permease [Rhodospirillaceae bacterium]MBT7293831.1 carbohydrate ABC transporter permease [Rhodospirillaceae bacterium]
MLRSVRRLSPLDRLGLCAALIFALFPVLWLFSKSFMPWVEYTANPAIWITSNPTFDNYHNVFFDYINLMGWPQSSSWRAMVSSAIISIAATFFSVLIGLLAAFAISRYRLGGNFMALQILSFRMVPPIAVAVPFAIIGTTIGATFTPVLLTLVYIAYTVPLATWMLKSFIDQTPREVEEAAMMDGMSRWRAHFRVTLPLMRGGLAATILFVFILNWSEGAIALALAAGRYVTIPVQIADKVASPHVQVSLAVLAAIPLLILGFSIQRHLSRGFTFGAIKQ